MIKNDIFIYTSTRYMYVFFSGCILNLAYSHGQDMIQFLWFIKCVCSQLTLESVGKITEFYGLITDELYFVSSSEYSLTENISATA